MRERLLIRTAVTVTLLADKSKIADVAAFLQAANTEMADYLKQRTTKYLDDVLFTASALMKNTFARSDAR